MKESRFIIPLLAAIVVLAVAAVPALAEGDTASSQGVNFGGPNAVGNQIAEDAEIKGAVIEKRTLESWFDWKQKIQEENGIALGIDYSAVFLKSGTDGLTGLDTGSGGILRFFGSWDLVGRDTKDTGALVWKIEHRHRYADIPPKDLSFELGYTGLFEPPFSNEGGRVTNLYWRQRLNDAKATLVGGFLDVTDYVDVFALASPWTGFMNFAFSTGSASAFLPNDATLGAAGATMLSDQFFVIGGLTNAYSDPTSPFEGFDTFFSDNEYFASIELGWTPSKDRIYFDNAHITFWHVDESLNAGTPGGWGTNFSYVRYLNKNLMPFIRGGYADDGGSLLQKSLSAGFGYQAVGSRDLLGVGVNWGEPNESSFGPGLRDQFTTEVFYRFQLAEQLALTPDLQLLVNPALNPNEDRIWVAGLRARLAM